ncbi:myelin and lymphocyte protein [Carassius auratus]|uniref:Myelin and lymphocyte protein n=1 Tax=Carassius auratus TaxID=7957 RepID=A0A6P6R6C0_CARAU|nr:myelin and lymphocyte protein-like [Carassius auratus]
MFFTCTTDTMASSESMMPSGYKIFTTMPDILFIPEFVFGGLMWTLVASTKVEQANPQGWVMFVSLFCLLINTLWFFIFITGINQKSIWPSLDVGYHSFSVFFYLSAAVLLANVTIGKQGLDKLYQLDIAAVILCKKHHNTTVRQVMAFIVTLLYWILSAHRWKSS